MTTHADRIDILQAAWGNDAVRRVIETGADLQVEVMPIDVNR